LSCHSGSATAEIWRHIDFSRWQPRSLSTTSGFVFVDVIAFRRSKSINKPNFVDISGQHISIYGWDITTSGLEKQRSTIFEFYFRFRHRPFSRNLHFILHQPAEFRPNRSSHCGNITSYGFIKMAAADAEYYFRFRISWYRCLQKVKVYEQTKFCRHISIDGWDLTTSVFEKQTSAILDFYFRFWSRPLPVISMSFCITLPNFVQNGAPTVEIWRHIHFSRWWPRPLNTTSGFVFVNVTAFRRSKSISKPNFVKIGPTSIGGWYITTSGFDLEQFAVIGVSFCTRLPNFVQIGTSAAEIWRHIDFQDGGRQPSCICFGVMPDLLQKGDITEKQIRWCAGGYHLFVIFAVLDVSFAVNSCLNWVFF